MTQRLAGKTAFVTAAGQGIGRAVAEAFVREGATVVATDLNEALLAPLKGRSGFGVRRLDVLDPAAITAAAKDVGAVDILFNGAGFVHAGTVLDCTEEEWAFAFDLNVRSQFRTIKAFVPGMLAKGGGSIINVASVAGSLKGAPNRFVYGTTKAAVIGLTKAVAADFITRGVRCNAICPGTVESPCCASASRRRPRRAGRRWRRSRPRSSPASRWAGSAASRKSPRWRCILRATNPPSLPAPPRSSTAAGRTNPKRTP